MARTSRQTNEEPLVIAWDDTSGFGSQNLGHLGLRSGRSIWVVGQTSVTSGGNVANQLIQTFALGALATGASTTVVLSNTLVNATTVLFGTPVPQADPGTGVMLQWWISARSAGVSITLGVRNVGGSTSNAIDCTAVLVN